MSHECSSPTSWPATPLPRGTSCARVEHRQHKGLNKCAERSHQPTRQRERTMRRFRITWPRATLPLCLWSDLRSFSAQTISSQRLGLSCPPAGSLPCLERGNRWEKSSFTENPPPPSSVHSPPLIMLFRKALPLSR